MCTAISLKAMGHYFGRNLDLDHSYNESVVITPRNYPFLLQIVFTIWTLKKLQCKEIC